MSKFFVTGISTEVGKTITSAILVEALQADYWKPIQAGDLDNCDTKKVQNLTSNAKSIFHKNSFALNTPMSPHAAAAIDKVSIKLGDIREPRTKNNLVIEGAGGLLVPINNNNTILDLIKPDYHIILVSRHYLGSINHSLLTLDRLRELDNDVSIIFSGDEHPTTEGIIRNMSNANILGRIEDEPYFDKNVILEYAERFKPELDKIIGE